MPETKTDLTSTFLQGSINPLEQLKCSLSHASVFPLPRLLAGTYGWKWTPGYVKERELHLSDSSLIIFVVSVDSSCLRLKKPGCLFVCFVLFKGEGITEKDYNQSPK